MLHRHPFLGLLTGSYLVFVGWFTLSPQESVGPATRLGIRILDALHRRGHVQSIDEQEVEFLANIALFVPVGVFLMLLVGIRFWWVPIVASLAMTSAIEWTQQHIPGRVPDERDLLANVIGGVAGAIVALVMMLPGALRDARRARRSARSRRPVRT